MFKSSMSVSPYHCPISKFGSQKKKKKRNRKFCPIGICDEGDGSDGLVAVFNKCSVIYTRKFNTKFDHVLTHGY